MIFDFMRHTCGELPVQPHLSDGISEGALRERQRLADWQQGRLHPKYEKAAIKRIQWSTG